MKDAVINRSDRSGRPENGAGVTRGRLRRGECWQGGGKAGCPAGNMA